MPNLDTILVTLRDDVQVFGAILVACGLLWMIPACFVGFTAAVQTEPTRWIDLPLGIFVGWGGGVPSWVIAFLISAGMLEIAGVGKSWPGIYREIPLLVAAVAASIVACVINYRASVWYFRERIQQLYGWTIDDPQPVPANHRYSFTLRRLLVVQIVAMFLFAVWVGARREMILQRYEYQRRETERAAYEESLETRFGGMGWNWYRFDRESLQLSMQGGSRGTLGRFTDQVLERLEPADHLQRIEIRSDALTDEGLAILCRNNELWELQIRSKQVTDAGIAHLARLKALKHVQLECPQLTEKSIDVLQSLESLKGVTLYSSTIPRQRGQEIEIKRPGLSFKIYSFGL